MNLIGTSIFTHETLSITVDNGIITKVDILESSSKKAIPFIAPGFFDIQVNGYISKDYSTPLGTKEIEQIVYHLAKGGVSQHVPTIITNSEENIIKSITSIVKAREESELIHNSIPALHIEGPFISPREGARGVHNPLYIRSADIQEFERWQEAAKGLIKIVTLSPEDDKAIEFIRHVSSKGIVVAIGHTDVPPEHIEKAIDAGATLSTHLGNGSPGMIPRLKNFIYKQLSDDRMNISIIADGFHLPPYVIDCFTKCKGDEHTILVSDVAALAGSAPGMYSWNGMNIEVHEDGHMGLHGTSNLAGASLLLDTCVAHLAKVSSFSLETSVKCATINPHRLLKSAVWDRNPIVGEKANFTLFSYDTDHIKIERTVLHAFDLFENQ